MERKKIVVSKIEEEERQDWICIPNTEIPVVTTTGSGMTHHPPQTLNTIFSLYTLLYPYDFSKYIYFYFIIMSMNFLVTSWWWLWLLMGL